MSQSTNHSSTSSRSSQQQQEAKDREKFESDCGKWCFLISGNVGKKHFRMVQFITSDNQEAYGSKWQKIVCNECEVPRDKRKEFWNRKGKATARATINRRRMNATNAIKKVFQGEDSAIMQLCMLRLELWLV
jgi:hypothetical protein